MRRANFSRKLHRRCAMVAIQVAVMLTVLIGFAALTVDVGAMYNAKGELQRTADAAALAAAAMLGQMTGGNPLDAARDEASQYASGNTVWGQSMQVDPDRDVVFGRAVYSDASRSYTFTPTDTMPNAVKVTVRLTSDSPNGAMSLFFAGIFGRDKANLAGEATAMMVPRDIALVADLSGSHNDDSELQAYKTTDINMHDVWDDFPGGIDDSPEEWSGLAYAPGDPQAAGPAWGIMKSMGYGTDPINASYNPTTDSGLISLPYNGDWNDPTVSGYLASFQSLGYSQTEIDAIMGNDWDRNGAWPARTAVALGLARWDSGKPGGLWDRLGITGGQVLGNADNNVGADELVWLETFGDRSVAESKAIFQDYINNYMNKTYTKLYRANSNFQYRFGVKTFMNYLMEIRPYNNDTPEFADARTQPMQAVKDSVNHMVNVITDLNTADLVSLEVYGTTARHEVDLTEDYSRVANRLDEMQAAYYDAWTNMGGGIQRGIEELTSSRARNASRKVMILLTDGIANVNASGQAGDYAGGRAYALAKAGEAANLGIQIYAVSVGAAADTYTMGEIAGIGEGEHYHAQGSIDEYSEQLDEIFQTLGGQRPVELIK